MDERDDFRRYSWGTADLTVAVYQIYVDSDDCIALAELIQTKFLE